jgi:hypothetical protein
MRQPIIRPSNDFHCTANIAILAKLKYWAAMVEAYKDEWNGEGFRVVVNARHPERIEPHDLLMWCNANIGGRSSNFKTTCAHGIGVSGKVEETLVKSSRWFELIEDAVLFKLRWG